MVKGGIRDALMQLIAGNKVGYWISKKCEHVVKKVGHDTLWVGGAICLIEGHKRTGFAATEFTYEGWRVTVERISDQSATDSTTASK